MYGPEEMTYQRHATWTTMTVHNHLYPFSLPFSNDNLHFLVVSCPILGLLHRGYDIFNRNVNPFCFQGMKLTKTNRRVSINHPKSTSASGVLFAEIQGEILIDCSRDSCIQLLTCIIIDTRWQNFSISYTDNIDCHWHCVVKWARVDIQRAELMIDVLYI